MFSFQKIGIPMIFGCKRITKKITYFSEVFWKINLNQIQVKTLTFMIMNPILKFLANNQKTLSKRQLSVSQKSLQKNTKSNDDWYNLANCNTNHQSNIQKFTFSPQQSYTEKFKEPEDAYDALLTDNIINLIVDQTNIYAKQT